MLVRLVYPSLLVGTDRSGGAKNCAVSCPVQPELSEGLAESVAPVMDAPLCYHRSLTSKHWGGDGPVFPSVFPDFTIHD
jgi:hypothetical protein